MTASIYNTDHQNHINNHIPEMMDDYSVDVSEMQSTVDPGGVGTESLATSLAGELERLRFALKGIVGKTHWYETPATDLESVGISLPNTIANVLTDHDKAAHDALNIDAATLDSLNSTQFLRSDQSDTMIGSLTLTGALLPAAGSEAAPAHSFSGDPNSGIYNPANGDVRIVSNSTWRFRVIGSDVQVNDGAARAVWHSGNVASSAPGLTSSKMQVAGYVDLPGGLILQWGEHNVPGDSTDTDSFAKVFPNACLQAVGGSSFGAGGANDDIGGGVATFNATTVTLFNNDAGTRLIRWMAIGH